MENGWRSKSGDLWSAATGAAMDIAEAVQYAHSQIQLARDQLPDPA
jgi:hypothetical protein